MILRQERNFNLLNYLIECLYFSDMVSDALRALSLVAEFVLEPRSVIALVIFLCFCYLCILYIAKIC